MRDLNENIIHVRTFWNGVDYAAAVRKEGDKKETTFLGVSDAMHHLCTEGMQQYKAAKLLALALMEEKPQGFEAVQSKFNNLELLQNFKPISKALICIPQ